VIEASVWFSFSILNPLLGLQGLVEAVGVAPPGHEPPGELVHDDHLAVLDDVVHIALEQVVRLEALEHVVLEGHVRGIEEVVDAEEFFHALHALVREGHGAGLLVHLEVAVGDEILALGQVRRAGEERLSGGMTVSTRR
jgi:hypothetical protein